MSMILRSAFGRQKGWIVGGIEGRTCNVAHLVIVEYSFSALVARHVANFNVGIGLEEAPC